MIDNVGAHTKNLALRMLSQIFSALLLLTSANVQSAEPRERIVALGDSVTKDVHRTTQRFRVRLSITTPLKYRNVPLDPTIDFSAILKQAGVSGVFDPNSIAVINLATGDQIPFARNEDFAYSDRGRLEWVVSQPQHTEYEIRFSTVEKRPMLLPQVDTPAIGVGDLLRYNTRRPKPITLFHSMGLHDLTGDGRPDLVGTWNYARRPGRPWDGIVCYPRVSDGELDNAKSAEFPKNAGKHNYQFSDLTRLRYSEPSDSAKLSFFGGLYSSAGFADFNGDGRLDLVSTRSGANAASFFLNTGKRDIGGFPIFAPAGTAKVTGWQACRAVDLNGDGAVDLIVDGQFVKNVADGGWPFKAAERGKQPWSLAMSKSRAQRLTIMHHEIREDFDR